MAQITLNSTGVASSGALVLQSNGTTTAVTVSTGQVATLVNDAVVNGLTVGRGAGAVATNTAVGASALTANTTGSESTAVGYQSLKTTSTSLANTAFGAYTLRDNTTGNANVAFGRTALVQNTTGASNTSIGTDSLYNNTTASNNTAVGYQAGYTNSTGANNVFLGNVAGYSSSGSSNLHVGYGAGYSSTGSNNTFVGAFGTGSTACGGSMTTGSKNTILGAYSGNQGGLDIRTASNHIVLSDGDGNPQGFFDNLGNFFIGDDVSTAASGGVVIASGFRGRAGTSGAQSNTFNINWTGFPFLWIDTTNIGQLATVSDYRIKENIQAQVEAALPKVMQLNPVKYNRKEIGIFAGSEDTEEGFIAHELQAVIPSAVHGDKDALTEDGGIQPQSLNWAPIVSVLTKAIQELKAEVDSLKAQINGASA